MSGDLIQIGNVRGPESIPDFQNDATRRRFLELMGASIALASGAGCTRAPTEFLMPYVHPPEQVIPGRPQYFATAVEVNGIAQGVVVESHLGRPTKVEGNARHPASLGATGVLSQASVLDLYDPFRSKEATRQGEPRGWDAFLAEFEQALAPLRAAKGEGLRVLTETVVSPSMGAQIAQVLEKLPQARWHQYDPAGAHASRAGSLAAFGRYVNTYYRLDAARVIVSLDSDFLACGPASTRYAHDYAAGRRVRGTNTSMNRLYAVESAMTSTGGKADHRIQMKYSEIGAFAVELARAIAMANIPAGAQHFANVTGPVARDLLANRGASAILVGENQPPALHALAHAMNASLGNAGRGVVYTEPVEARPEDQIASLQQLVSDMQLGRVKLLVIVSGNPVYNAPADIDFAGATKRVPMTVHLGLHRDETSQRTLWHVPQSHFFEEWGDARAYDGTVTILQPLIEPLYASHSRLEFVNLFLQMPNWPSRRIVRAYWQSKGSGADFDQWWRNALAQGLVSDSALPEITPTLQTIDTEPLLQTANSVELTFRTDPYLYDGRYASNPWLQELPRPITKLSWDNAVLINARTAQKLNLQDQHVVELNLGGRRVEGAVWFSPGQPDDSIAIHLGYGRTNAGVIGNGAGFNAYPLRTSSAMWFAPGVQVRPTGKTYPLAVTQLNHDEHGRGLVVSSPVSLYQQNPDFVKQDHPEPAPSDTLYPQWKFPKYNWGMAIDLTSCVNCSACVIACQAENNIPVVGKEQVLFNRWMYWLRVDVYFEGDWNRPSASYAPIPCMQCEDAPCELVCPVQATVHSSDGLNDMIYNRCVGTRFCSNNCPYKVRRFNFLLYADWYTEQLQMQSNPDVTVRSRGVMEKCTYCVQRIREAEIRARDEDRDIRDGEVKTACQQVCPSKAIVFGNMNDPASEVSRWKRERLNYSMLADLNTRPHTTYLAELRNPNPELART